LERRPPEKSAAASAPRRANVSVYDYDTNRLYLLVVNLQSGAIESMQSQQQQQPALNANEIKRAASILAKDAAAVQAIAHAYARASGGPPSSHDAIDTSTLVFSRLFATGQTNQRSEKCGAHRCAQIMFFALENVVLDTIAVIDLSRGEVAQLLPFGDARAQ
jgi:Cu2+-containing amine oxidase